MKKQTAAIFFRGLLALSLTLAGCSSERERGKYTKEAVKEAHDNMDRMDSASAYEKSMQLFTIGKLGEALEEAEASIQLADNVIDTHLLRLQIFIEIDKSESEINLLIEACNKRWPEEARFIYYLGVYYERRGNIIKALESYKKAAEIDSNDVLYKMATAEMYLEDGQIDKSKEYLKNACKTHPNAPGLLQTLGYISQIENNNIKAKQYFIEAYSLAPDERALQENLACMYYELGEYEDALRLFDKLLPLSENRLRNDLKVMAVRSYLRTNNPIKAKNLLNEMMTNADCDLAVVWREMLNIALMLDDMLLCEEAVNQLQAISAGSETATLAAAIFHHKNGDISKTKSLLKDYNGDKSTLFTRYENSLLAQ